MGSKETQGIPTEGAQKRGEITLETVAFDLYRRGALNWEDVFSKKDWEIRLIKGVGPVRVGIIRGFQAALDNHKREYANTEVHVVTESFWKFGEPRSMIIDDMEVPFISSEAEFMVKEMLDGSPMSKSEYFEEMELKRFKKPEEILRRHIDFLNKYFHLGLTLRKEKIDGVDIYYFLKKPETTQVRFGEQPTKQ